MKITGIKLRTVEGWMPGELSTYNTVTSAKVRYMPTDYAYDFKPIADFGAVPPPPREDGYVAKKANFLYIETDAGITGIGGHVTCSPNEMKVYSKLLIGEDPYNTERIWEIMHRTLYAGTGSHYMKAISAIDVALWDIKCRAANLPLYKMIGGKTQKELPCYASSAGCCYGEDDYDISLVPDYIRGLKAEGYRGVKWWVHRGPCDGEQGIKDIELLVRTIRETAGPDFKIMLDCWCAWTYDYTLRVANRIKDYDIFWIEEPLLPTQRVLLAELIKNCPINISFGEHLLDRYEVRDHVEHGCRGILQPDVLWGGGITEMLKIIHYCQTEDILVVPHCSVVPVTVQVSATVPVDVLPISEYLLHMMESSMHFYKNPVRPVNGVFQIPEIVGVGIDVDETKVEKENWIDLTK